MTQLPLEGMPRRLYACTPSRLNAWLDCPRRYRFSYLDRPPPPKGPPWAHNSLGASVHNALAGWWKLPLADRTPAAAARLLTSGWISEGFRDDRQSGEWRARAASLVSGYVTTLDPADEPIGVERTVAMRTRTLAVSGRVDRLDQRGSELVVVDYKTGRRPLFADDARSSLALALYALATGRMFHKPCLAVELHHLPTGEILSWRHTPESLERHLNRAEVIAAEASAADEAYRSTSAPDGAAPASAEVSAKVRGEVSAEIDARFPPRAGTWCSWCDFRRHCPEGQAASTELKSWDGLDTSQGPPLVG